MGQRIIFPEKGVVALEEFEPPALGPEDIRVKTLASLISIGTETTILQKKYDEGSHFAEMFSFPQMQTGNQSVGVVERVGDDVQDIIPGDRVFLRKAHASHWTLPASSSAPIPARIDTSSAIWCGLAKIAFRAAQAAPFQLGGEVLIIGAGPVGQMAARWALVAGMRRVVISDLSEQRLLLVSSRCIPHAGSVIDRRDDLLALADGAGFQCVVDTTGNPAVFQTALSLAAEFGKVVLLGDTGFPAQQCLTSDLMMRGVSVVATHEQLDRDGWTQGAIDSLFFQLVADGVFEVQGLITHQFAPEQYEEAYDLIRREVGGAVGVSFNWAQE